ncbi:dihydroxyacetone kinase subunit DhaK [Arcanobacterium buesumense]|uniref:phosphoenolpyruvate--glycerone phosphotransferase n=1 Tax=Arcanobacterium buesumense TaxID=2722751 RepID=A0A6H2ELV9_9ACTO|nr:dihydroxyacetone kinase subunit DhaK [Arcanobacterium buesumense]QJC22059.1 dihydroxyacetone kinase subunit DhaK [Arcanobacterium buesumense]
MKKLINNPANVVTEALLGMELAHPQLRIDHEKRVIFRTSSPTEKVALISGGGSGHEPLHGGFVGTGMLDAAVAGEIFTSPTPGQVSAAISGTDGGKGALLIIKNYTGDVLNFQMAAELAQSEGIDVNYVVVKDDVAVEDSSFTAGRRGVGLTVLLEKIAGAAAEEGQSLDEVTAVAQKVIEQGRSMGVALTSVTLPAVGKPSFDLPEDEIEMGVGIHGEPGRHRIKMKSAHEIAQDLVDAILTDYDFTHSDAIVMLNGMGATPLVELYIMYGEVARLLAQRGVRVVRNLVGNYITSIDMAGCSLTILKADDELLRLWDAPVATPALTWGHTISTPQTSASAKLAHKVTKDQPAKATAHRDRHETGQGITLSQMRTWIELSAQAMDTHQDQLTELDAAIGDADHGANIARGMSSALNAVDKADPDSFAEIGKVVGMSLVSSVGGASGPLYGTFFLRFGQEIGDVDEVDVPTLAAAFRAGVDGVRSRGKADAGEKTMLDVFMPVADVLEAYNDAQLSDALSAAQQAAFTGRDQTIDMIAKKGRASYLGERSIGHIDPGAASAALLVDALVTAVMEK